MSIRRHGSRMLVAMCFLWVSGCALPGPVVPDIHGRNQSPLGPDGSDLVALIFTSPDCPVANAMTPEFERLHQRTKAAGGTLYLVHVRGDVTAKQAHSHATQRGMTMEVLLDGDHALVNHLGASVTPEGIVLVREGSTWRTVYQGRINNLYAAIGDRRDKATRHWMREAIDAAAAGANFEKPWPSPIGCFIEATP
ncbi:MAG: redoxin domain-containing protein [Phycisphaerales bacterium]|nr:redoxin domain-containing protein [Phycisphaerales bacterium]